MRKAPFDFAHFNNLDPNAPIEACLLENINFLDGSFSNGGTAIIDWHWDFGDGTTSSAQNPVHSYSVINTYSVKLTVTNACNCTNTYQKYVDVGRKSVSISCPGVVCDGQTSVYKLENDFKGTCQNFNWSVIGGQFISGPPYGADIGVLWTAPPHDPSIEEGFGYITFDPADCPVDCYAPTSLKIPIIRNQMDPKGDIIVCGKSQHRYTMPKWPTTDFVWTIDNGGGTNASVIYTDQRDEIILDPGDVPGTIVLNVTYQNTLLNCGGTGSITINIKADAFINGALLTCLGATENYTVGGLSGTWNLKKLPSGSTTTYTGSTYSPTFTSVGNYSLTVSGTNFCSSKAIFINVKSAVTPLDTEITGTRIICPSTPSIFTNTNTIPGTVLGWSVPLGTGTIVGSSYGNSVQVVFDYPTSPPNTPYAITVWRENAEDPICKSPDLIIPLAPEVLDVAITGITIPCGSSYQNYEVPAVNGDTYEWSISPTNAGSITTNGSHIVEILWNQFAAPYNATIKLKVKKCNIEYPIPTGFSTLDVIIENPLISIIPPTGPICRNTVQQFSIATTPALDSNSGLISWSFGDGTIAVGATVNHIYTGSGPDVNYPVTVTVPHPNACLGTISATANVLVNANPEAFLTPASFQSCDGTVNQTFTVTVVPGYSYTSIVWYNSSNVALTPLGVVTPSFPATNFGIYYAVVSNGTCSTILTAKVEDCGCTLVNPVPALTLSAVNDCGTVTATGSYPLTPVPTGAGFTSDITATTNSASSATFNFTKAGYHNITYVVSYDVNGDECPVKKSQNVLIPYVANVSAAITCNTGSGAYYQVVLNDVSDVYPGTPVQSWVFTVDGVVKPQGGSDPMNGRTISLLAGATYTIGLSISNSGYPACYKAITIVLPAKPTATFIFDDNVCQGSSTQFTVTGLPQTDVTYSWDFGDFSNNLQKNPDREYAGYGIFNPTLTVTNQYGCSATSSPVNLNVRRNDQDGNIATPAFACPGGTAALHLDVTNYIISSYQWLYNNSPITGATYNDYGASLSGSYSVIVGNPNGCTRRIAQNVPVAIANPPFSEILGSNYGCSGQPITLHVNSGAGSTLLYEWTRNDTGALILSNTAQLMDSPTAGNYVYTLTVMTPLTGGGFCTNTLTHAVTVVDPANFTAVYAVVECEPYTVTLHAQVDDAGSGFFNWSDGQSGAVINEDQGGVYEVIYTNAGGCSVSYQLNVPKNPENYMWIFPSGCYTFCDKFTTGTLIGPDIVDFVDWQWLQNDLTQEEDSGHVADYVLPSVPSATYNLLLNSGGCKIISDDMNVSVVTCDCKVTGTLKGSEMFTSPFYYYQIDVHIDNATGGPIVVVVTAGTSTGVLTPGTVTVPNGGADFTFTLLPDSLFTGGPIDIILHRTTKTGELCQGKIPVTLAQNGSGGNSLLVAADSQLVLAPNPTSGQVLIHFDYGNAISGKREIAIYDLLGHLSQIYIAQDKQDSWTIDMSSYPAGQYVVVMRLDGVIVQQKNLLVAH